MARINIIVSGQGTQIMLMRVDTAQANGSPRLDSSPGQRQAKYYNVIRRDRGVNGISS